MWSKDNIYSENKCWIFKDDKNIIVKSIRTTKMDLLCSLGIPVSETTWAGIDTSGVFYCPSVRKDSKENSLLVSGTHLDVTWTWAWTLWVEQSVCLWDFIYSHAPHKIFELNLRQWFFSTRSKDKFIKSMSTPKRSSIARHLQIFWGGCAILPQPGMPFLIITHSNPEMALTGVHKTLIRGRKNKITNSECTLKSTYILKGIQNKIQIVGSQLEIFLYFWSGRYNYMS